MKQTLALDINEEGRVSHWNHFQHPTHIPPRPLLGLEDVTKKPKVGYLPLDPEDAVVMIFKMIGPAHFEIWQP